MDSMRREENRERAVLVIYQDEEVIGEGEILKWKS